MQGWAPSRFIQVFGDEMNGRVDRGSQGELHHAASSKGWSTIASSDRRVRTTLLLMAFILPIQFVLAMIMALVIHARIKFSSMFLYIFSVPLGMSDLAVGILFFSIFTGNGFLNTILDGLGIIDGPQQFLTADTRNWIIFAIVLAEVWRATSIVMVIIVSGLQAIPDETLEAAELFGASYWQRVRHIMLPLLRPSIQVALILQNDPGAPGVRRRHRARRWDDRHRARQRDLPSVLRRFATTTSHRPTPSSSCCCRWPAPSSISERFGPREEVRPHDQSRRPTKPRITRGRIVTYAVAGLVTAVDHPAAVLPVFDGLHHPGDGAVLSQERAAVHPVLHRDHAVLPGDRRCHRGAEEQPPRRIHHADPVHDHFGASRIRHLAVHLPGRDVFRLSILAVRAFPIVVLSIPLAVLFLRAGIFDSLYSLALMHTALTLPTTILIIASVFASVPYELEEAGQVFGASPLQAFRYIVLPLVLPGIAASSVFTFVLSWNEVFAASHSHPGEPDASRLALDPAHPVLGCLPVRRWVLSDGPVAGVHVLHQEIPVQHVGPGL